MRENLRTNLLQWGGTKIWIQGAIQLDLELDNTNLKCNIHSAIIKFKIPNTKTHEEVC